MRRYLSVLGIGIVFCLAVANFSTYAQKPSPKDPYSQQVKAGVAYFQKRGQEQLKLAEELLTALKSGDINQAQEAYINARPPYEEIELTLPPTKVGGFLRSP
jgi:iron uptake system component EfeO